MGGTGGTSLYKGTVIVQFSVYKWGLAMVTHAVLLLSRYIIRTVEPV